MKTSLTIVTLLSAIVWIGYAHAQQGNESWRPGTNAWYQQQQLNAMRRQNQILEQQRLDDAARRFQGQQQYWQPYQPFGAPPPYGVPNQQSDW